MGGFFNKIQAKLELWRLEQRYTRHRNRRSTFVSNAIYVDGEYVYQTPNTTGSSSDSESVRIDALHGEKHVMAPKVTSIPEPLMGSVPESSFDDPPVNRKRLNRYSSMPAFGGDFNNSRRDLPSIQERRTSMIR